MIKFKLRVLLAMNETNQRKLAEKTGIREATLSAMNKGTLKQLPLDVLEKICKELHCQVGDLIEYIEDDEEKE